MIRMIWPLVGADEMDYRGWGSCDSENWDHHILHWKYCKPNSSKWKSGSWRCGHENSYKAQQKTFKRTILPSYSLSRTLGQRNIVQEGDLRTIEKGHDRWQWDGTLWNNRTSSQNHEFIFGKEVSWAAILMGAILLIQLSKWWFAINRRVLVLIADDKPYSIARCPPSGQLRVESLVQCVQCIWNTAKKFRLKIFSSPSTAELKPKERVQKHLWCWPELPCTRDKTDNNELKQTTWQTLSYSLDLKWQKTIFCQPWTIPKSNAAVAYMVCATRTGI